MRTRAAASGPDLAQPPNALCDALAFDAAFRERRVMRVIIGHMAQTHVEEGAELEQLGLERLGHLFARLDGIGDLNQVQIDEGSQLDRDARLNPYDPADQQVIFCSGVAADHLGTLSRHTQAEGLPTYAGFTLIRAAVEACSQGIWLLSGGTDDKRLFRALQAILRSRNDADALARSLGLTNPAGYERMSARLDELKNQRPGLRSKSLDRDLKTTEVVLDAGRHVDRVQGLTGLDVWRAGSGFAHGNRTTAMMFMERRVIADHPERKSSDYYVTSSWYVTSLMVEVAIAHLERMHEMFERAARAPKIKSRGRPQ